MSANLIVGKDPTGNKVPVAVDAAGKIQIGGVQLDNLNVNTDQIEGKQDVTNALLTTQAADLAATKASAASIAGMAIPPNDFISLSYTSGNLTGVVYKTGGSSGTTVATLTLAYSGSDLISVTKS
jgi:hypothetical protein